MNDFFNLTDEQKVALRDKLLKCANEFGGVNFFLQLISPSLMLKLLLADISGLGFAALMLSIN